MTKLTIETLEKMFTYLGCANIRTTEAMDGAIPVESIASNEVETLACFKMEELEKLGSVWCSKLVWFAGDSLQLLTTENLHWTRVLDLCHGYGFKKTNISSYHGFATSFYSQIGCDGKFKKFEIKPFWSGDVVVKKIFNPRWVSAFQGETMKTIRCDNVDVYKRLGLSMFIPFSIGLRQSLDSYWLVNTKFEEVCPKLCLLTDATGVKEFWKLRDIPTGKKRRTALLHWVENHWRKLRSDPDVETYVRKHLRGETEIKHGNFQASIVPSKADSVENEMQKQSRRELRKLKQDRRKRQNLLEKGLVRK